MHLGEIFESLSPLFDRIIGRNAVEVPLEFGGGLYFSFAAPKRRCQPFVFPCSLEGIIDEAGEFIFFAFPDDVLVRFEPESHGIFEEFVAVREDEVFEDKDVINLP